MNNDKKHQVHNLIILDESGSMQAINRTIIQAFNELAQTIQGIDQQFPEQVHYISFISFNGVGRKIWHFLDLVSKLDQIDDIKYHPTANTPFFDPIGSGIQIEKD